MAIFREFASEDIVSEQDVLEQLVDILQNDISASISRKQYQVWVTGGVGPGVTSSMYQTIFDQDFTLQTANPIFDMTFGLSANSDLVNTGSLIFIDTNTNKYYFSSQSIQMREKMDNYREFAQNLLGDATSEFSIVTGSTTVTIREPLFFTFKRIFARDRLKRESFAIRLFQTASNLTGSIATTQKIYTDVGSAVNIEQSFAGQVSTIVDSADTSYPVGLVYLDKGILVLDTQRVFDLSTEITGTIDAVDVSGFTTVSGTLNNVFVSASLDDIIDHLSLTRFGSSSQTSIVFQNETFINSTLFFCRFPAEQFNYSSNPTYTDSTGRIIVIDQGQEETQRSFSFITSIGLYDAFDNLLGVAKISRPIFKDRTRDFSIRVRLDT